jgi:hypothetical protein
MQTYSGAMPDFAARYSVTRSAPHISSNISATGYIFVRGHRLISH